MMVRQSGKGRHLMGLIFQFSFLIRRATVLPPLRGRWLAEDLIQVGMDFGGTTIEAAARAADNGRVSRAVRPRLFTDTGDAKVAPARQIA
ncbi:hypothetical protein [Nitrospirillum sp. BR 11163]|uniref:hypothetical protein n=1 Tax=Nitrospirillum sp. BR 11163 TaxID=3104323 RepID=UPI002B0026DD|nr:hypothetical protein [Nitrospirillum sp. BR 11163]MEA1675848.1 hypothetical protein [Nitrospirillum sp. BR 11163]